MGRIHILDVDVQNRIAAGEVIERPASVIKELIENAIDASARKITVETEKGGISSIRVTDDGEGIGADELELALERHATSKVTDAEELSRIHTMGFRGEALPSIASVSRFSLSSRPSGTDSGTMVTKEGSALPVCSDVGMAEGTVVKADSIFFNVPARRKFLKTPATELKHISRTVTQISLAYPEIHFSLKNNRAETLNYPACSDMRERCIQAFGRDIRDNLLETDIEATPCSLKIFGAKPGISRKNSRSIYSYVNKRYFRGREVIHAVREGYTHHIPRDEWPFTVLYISADPDAVDVNVHPNKLEVRFREPGELHALIKNTINRMLGSKNTAVSYPVDGGFPDRRESSVIKPVRNNETGLMVMEEQELFRSVRDRSSEEQHIPEGFHEVSGRKFMQVYDSYIIVEYEDAVTVYDQHALHEGILEQKLREQFKGKGLPCQDLLIPEQVELAQDEKDTLLQLQPHLQKLGFEVQEFSGNTVIIHSVPQIMDVSRIQKFISDVLSLESEYGDKEEKISSILLSSLINRIACHSAIRAGQKLNAEEIDALLKEARMYPDSSACAHGRPSSFDIPKQEIAKRFRRT